MLKFNLKRRYSQEIVQTALRHALSLLKRGYGLIPVAASPHTEFT